MLMLKSMHMGELPLSDYSAVRTCFPHEWICDGRIALNPVAKSPHLAVLTLCRALVYRTADDIVFLVVSRHFNRFDAHYAECVASWFQRVGLIRPAQLRQLVASLYRN